MSHGLADSGRKPEGINSSAPPEKKGGVAGVSFCVWQPLLTTVAKELPSLILEKQKGLAFSANPLELLAPLRGSISNHVSSAESSFQVDFGGGEGIRTELMELQDQHQRAGAEAFAVGGGWVE
jgi:hypothetical protein